MSMLLQVVLALAVAALTAFLIPLLLQLRRTAAALEHFSESAARDLNQVAGDLRETRLRIEGLADMAQAQMEHPGALSQIAFGVARAIPAFLNPDKNRSPLFEGILTGADTLFTWFRNRSGQPTSQPSSPAEAPHE